MNLLPMMNYLQTKNYLMRNYLMRNLMWVVGSMMKLTHIFGTESEWISLQS
jgi:aminoglycoside/choline kinase family phosphotransferase